jgi:hypothetical protein
MGAGCAADREGGGRKEGGSRGRAPGVRALGGAIALVVAAISSGCVTSQKSQYVRHLNATVSPNAAIPGEALVTFDIERKRLPTTAIAAGK